MNPLAVVLIGIGFLLLVIGFKGSQHNVMSDIKGIRRKR